MILSSKSIDQALASVIGELHEVGLLTNKLHAVEVYHHVIDITACHGLYVEDCSMVASILGFKPRSIYIPRVSWSRVAESINGLGRSTTSLRDVLRHKYGHAFAVEHPSLVRRSSEFRAAFGTAYDSEESEYPYCPSIYVSPYAATAPYEDFAETFMCFVKYGGRIERYRKRPIVFRKMKFIQSLTKKIKRKGLLIKAA